MKLYNLKRPKILEVYTLIGLLIGLLLDIAIY